MGPRQSIITSLSVGYKEQVRKWHTQEFKKAKKVLIGGTKGGDGRLGVANKRWRVGAVSDWLTSRRCYFSIQAENSFYPNDLGPAAGASTCPPQSLEGVSFLPPKGWENNHNEIGSEQD